MVRFQEDIWVGDEPFKDRFSNLFRISLLKNKPISLFWFGFTTSFDHCHVLGSSLWSKS